MDRAWLCWRLQIVTWALLPMKWHLWWKGWAARSLRICVVRPLLAGPVLAVSDRSDWGRFPATMIGWRTAAGQEWAATGQGRQTGATTALSLRTVLACTTLLLASQSSP